MSSGQQLSTNHKLELLNELYDQEYRRGFVEGHAKDTIAFQIRQLRKAEGWEQRDLARELGNPKLQPMISRYENPDYGKYSISTLLELAAAFDVALVVRFAPFSELVEWDWQSTPSTLAPNKYSKDKRLATLRKTLSGPSPIGKLADFPGTQNNTFQEPGDLKPSQDSAQNDDFGSLKNNYWKPDPASGEFKYA